MEGDSPLLPAELLLGFNSLSSADLAACARLAEEALALYRREELRHLRDLAERIKRELDSRTRCSWNVVVGTRFGCATTVEKCAAALFELGGLTFFLWRLAAGP